jgi:hypothetical protein
MYGILIAFSLANGVVSAPHAPYSSRIYWEIPGGPGEALLPESLFIVDNTEDDH